VVDYVSETPPASREEMDGSWLHEVCLIGQGARCCRYIVCGPGGFDCAKHDPVISRTVDARVEARTMNARADNCPGLAAERAEIAP
jgi:hypothetical protein